MDDEELDVILEEDHSEIIQEEDHSEIFLDEDSREETAQSKPRRVRLRRFFVSKDSPVAVFIRSKIAPWLARLADSSSKGLVKAKSARKWIKIKFGEFRERYDSQQQLTNLASLLFGAVLLMFGRYFVYLFTVMQALRQSTGFDAFVVHVERLLKEQVESLKQAQAEDSLQLAQGPKLESRKELVKHKLQMVKESLVNPKDLQEAALGMWQVFLSAMTSVKFRTAQYITMGLTMAENLQQVFLHPVLVPLLAKALQVDEDLQDDREKRKQWFSFLSTSLSNIIITLLALVIGNVEQLIIQKLIADPQSLQEERFFYSTCLSILATSSFGACLVVDTLLDMVLQDEEGRVKITKAVYISRDVLYIAAFGLGFVFQVALTIATKNQDRPPQMLQALLFPMYGAEKGIRFLARAVKNDTDRFVKVATKRS